MQPSQLTKAERAARSGKSIPVCPHCGEPLTRAQIAALMGKLGGSATSKRKAKSSAENGKLGGRPRKTENPS